MEVFKGDLLELSVDEDLSVYVNLPDVIDLDSDDTDYSGDEEENPAGVDQDYVLKEEQTPSASNSTFVAEPVVVMEEGVDENTVETVSYNNSKYFKKKESFQTDTNNSVSTFNKPQSNSNNGISNISINENGKRRRSNHQLDNLDIQVKQENLVEQENAVDIKHENIVEIKQENNVEIKQENNVDIKQENNVDVKQENIVDTKQVPENSDNQQNNQTDVNDDTKQVIKLESDLTEQVLKKHNTIREWTFNRYGEDLRTGNRFQRPHDVKFRILSYNILSQGRIDRQRHSFKNKSSDYLTWNYRLQAIVREVTTVMPDIICFQQLDFRDDNHINIDIEDLLTGLGYDYKAIKRKDPKMDGCAIFFKTLLFTCDKATLCELDNSYAEWLTDSNNVGLVCRLQSLKNSAKLVVGTLHLKFGLEKQLTRLAQTAVFMADLQELCYEENVGFPHPCIIAGDFNLEPYSDVHKLLVKGQLKYRGLLMGAENYPDHIFPPNFGIDCNMRWTLMNQHNEFGSGYFCHNLGFRSVYRYRGERALYLGFAPPESEVTAFQGKWVAVDHIFYSTLPIPEYFQFSSNDGRYEKQLKYLGKWSLPTASEICKLGGLPSCICPSDHLPLAADFILTAS